MLTSKNYTTYSLSNIYNLLKLKKGIEKNRFDSQTNTGTKTNMHINQNNTTHNKTNSVLHFNQFG